MRTYDLLRKSVRHGQAPCNPKSERGTLAIFHLSTIPIGRGNGRSAVAAAAYRSGCELTDNRTGIDYDYTRKGGIIYTGTLTADGQTADRQKLWDAAEAAEKRKDARTAREWRAALPAELGRAQQIELVKSFSQELTDRYGVAADFAIHEPDRHGDNRNYHAHILVTTRTAQVDERGNIQLGEKASIELSDKKRREMGMSAAADEVTAIRQLWEQRANHALEKVGSHERIDCRSLVAQGVDREPTIKEGYKARKMEREGVTSDRSETNREINADNQRRTQLQVEIIELQKERYSSMTASQLYAEINRRTPPDPKEALMKDKKVKSMTQEYLKQKAELEKQQQCEVQAKKEIQGWRKAHGIRAKLHDTGVARSKDITRNEQIINESRQRQEAIKQSIEQNRLRNAQILVEAAQRVGKEQANTRAELAKLKELADQKAAQEKAERQRQREEEPQKKTRDRDRGGYSR